MADTPRLDADAVRQFVNDAHGNFDSVRRLLELQPALVTAPGTGVRVTGGPDWVRPPIWAAATVALYLLERGARMDIFAAAMLGHLV